MWASGNTEEEEKQIESEIWTFPFGGCVLQKTWTQHKRKSLPRAALSIHPVEFGTDALGVFALRRCVSNRLVSIPLHFWKQHCVTLLDVSRAGTSAKALSLIQRPGRKPLDSWSLFNLGQITLICLLTTIYIFVLFFRFLIVARTLLHFNIFVGNILLIIGRGGQSASNHYVTKSTDNTGQSKNYSVALLHKLRHRSITVGYT